jgi:hypothetical protein
MSKAIRLGEFIEVEDLVIRPEIVRNYDFEERKPAASPSTATYSSLPQPEQIGVVISGFGIDTRATPIYAGRISRLL